MGENAVEIVVSGAGPNGLMTAGELALAGVRPIVLDALPEPSAEPKANGLVGQVVRVLDMRGLYHELGGPPGPPPAAFAAFSGIPLPLDGVPDNPMRRMLIPQPRLVRHLEAWARGLGAEIRWGHGLTEVTQRDGGVDLIVTGPDGPYPLRTRYLVGADGGRSLVRKSAGIGFPGFTAPMVLRIAHVHLPAQLRADDGGIALPGGGRIPFGHNRVDRGGVVVAELEPGRPLIGTIEFGDESVCDDTPMTVEELRKSLRRVLGVDLPVEPPRGDGPHALRRINGQNTRQADRYRDGNVFLVGDAAHVHSPIGGPGLNLGLQDAVNLGWKLAAAVNGWAPTGLLDSYQRERYPVGERVMMHSMSQTALMAPGPEVAALRALFGELTQNPDTAAHLARLLAGSDTRYDVGDDHPLSGYLVPELALSDGRRVAEAMRAARPLLLDRTGGVFAESVPGWADRVDAATVTSSATAVAALLIRPDGYVAWAADDARPDGVDRLHAALRRWFGAPDTGDAM
ncbi:FAD-dependent monooxygenase [Mycobacterium talmoniae]|uniref:FAD-dependent oxidoreductase n=1 Tax=Mycobacterium talmoniae TaxID=1858794 RepID=A0A1S1NI52_9MYCO|nr:MULTISPECIES: FAD-dependent monooxygenase [Mycobacterium]OHV00363.1 FAD-dependent oxidoreductase [Mycobacterium talmoniae]TDH50027.1 FAD-dependent oxidoreductase [Mycobacterium eburneum]